MTPDAEEGPAHPPPMYSDAVTANLQGGVEPLR